VKKNKQMQTRAIETRDKLLQAAADSLAEVGFAQTTTQSVVKRAKATRGTLLYHFPNREDMLIAAVEFVLDQNVTKFQGAMDAMKGRKLSLREIVKIVWEEYWTDDGFFAWLELVVASRTDPALNKKVREMNVRWVDQFTSAFRAFFSRDLDGIYLLFILVLNGLSLETLRSEPKLVQKMLNDILDSVSFAERLFLIHPEATTSNTKE
jgi:AcrR family transcriptional regulator